LRTLVADLEESVKERGGLTVSLGTGDNFEQTTLSGINLFPHVWEHLSHPRNLKNALSSPTHKLSNKLSEEKVGARKAHESSQEAV
jgi:hypothetical protein